MPFACLSSPVILSGSVCSTPSVMELNYNYQQLNRFMQQMFPILSQTQQQGRLYGTYALFR